MFNGGADIFLSVLGIPPSDPLGHLSFLMHEEAIFKDLLTEELITTLATETDPQKFNEGVKAVEKKIAQDRKMIPIGHFPGIVATAPHFERDPHLAWSWGIQSWTYRIH